LKNNNKELAVNNYENIPEELRALKQWIDKIKDRFRYDPETGNIFYKPRWITENSTPRHKQWNTMFAFKEVTGWFNEGYIRISFDGKQIYLHQIAFAIMKNYIPLEVDHEDKDRSNNRWINLRDADRFKNSANVFKRHHNKSGIKGVSWSSSNNCWRMDIAHNKIKYYGYYSTIEAAYEAS